MLVACSVFVFAVISLTVFLFSSTESVPSVLSGDPPIQISGNSVFINDGADSDKPAYAPGEIILRLNSPLGQVGATIDPLNTGAPGIDRINRLLGVTRIELVSEKANDNVKGLFIYKFSFSASTDVKDAAQQYSGLPIIAYAEPDYMVTTANVDNPDDPYWSSSGSWAQSYDDLWALKKIDAFNAWQVTTGDPSTVVAVLDTGLDMSHPDIQANVWNNAGEIGTDGSGKDKRSNGIDDDGNGYVDDWRGWDFQNNDNDPTDDMGHGSHVSGTIAATANNGTGVVGVNWQAKIMPLKFLDASGSGYLSDAIPAIIYAADNGARVSNNSWGGAGYSQSLADAFTYAYDIKGMTNVAAAGNSNANANLYQPGAFPSVITVAATDVNDAKASFSNWGSKIDVAAPGVDILSLKGVGTSMGFTVGGNYSTASGTSMATPHVAGLAALILSDHPDWSNEQVRQVIRSSSDDLGAAGRDDYFGYGRINAAAALNAPSPLAAFLSGPAGKVQGTVDITGTAAGSGFISYKLEYGLGKTPSTWNTIASSNQPVTNGVLYSGFDSSLVPDGDLTFRLTVNGSGSSVEQLVSATIENVYISSPNNELIAHSPGKITITGRAAGANFSGFRVVSGDGQSPSTWSSDGITLTGGGTREVISGSLATWDISGITQPGFHTIKLVVTFGARQETEIVTFYVDPALHPGWPKSVDIGSYLAFMDVPAVADVDGNGQAETAFAYGDQVYLIRSDGSDVPGWPKTIPHCTSCSPESSLQRSPALGDLDGDGKLEIVLGTGAALYAWHSDGTDVTGWPQRSITGYALPVIADIDGDGMNEVVSVTTSSSSSGIAIIDGNGKIRSGWPVATPTGRQSQPAVGDVNGDGVKDIVLAGSDGMTYAYSTAGNILPGWPTSTHVSTPYSYPVLVDTDGDGSMEVIIGSYDRKVHVLDGNGTELPGWPQTTASPVMSTPSAGDLDGDGNPEIIAGCRTDYSTGNLDSRKLYVWHTDGSLLPGWPVTADTTDTPLYGFGSSAIADIDDDGNQEIIVENDTNYLNAYEISGAQVKGFPKYMGSKEGYTTNTPAVGDFDNDGTVEIVGTTSDKKIFMWDLPAAVSSHDDWPQFRHDPAHTGAYEAVSVTLPPSTPPATKPAVSNVLPSGWINSASAVVSADITGSEISLTSISVDLDGAPLGNCSFNGATVSCPVTNLASGNHAVSVSATNSAGTGTGTAVFQVDTAAPTLAGLTPYGTTSDTSPVISASYADTGSGIDRNTAGITLDGNDLHGCTADTTSITCPAPNLSDDDHNFVVSVRDNAGNSTLATGSFTVDSSAPAITNLEPASWLAAGAAIIGASYFDGSGSGVNPASVVVVLDGAILDGCTVGSISVGCPVSGLAGGSHLITVYAGDYAGNTGSTSGSFAIDIEAPAAAFTQPSSLINKTFATVSATYADSGSGIDSNSVQMFMDGKQLSGCSVTAADVSCQVSGLSEGMHDLSLTVMDNVGNSIQATAVLGVDSIAPSITGLPSVVTNSRDVIIMTTISDAGTGIDTKTITLSLDGNGLAGCTLSGTQLSCAATGLSDGVHKLVITVDDLAGNSTAAAGSITVDTVAPTFSDLMPMGIISDRNVKFLVTLSDNLSGINPDSAKIALNYVPIDGCTLIDSQLSCSINNLNDGTYTVTLSGSDMAGNENTATWYFTKVKVKNNGHNHDHVRNNSKKR